MTADPIIPDSDFFTTFESNVVKCLRRASGRSGFSAANAVTHLRRAWEIRRIDEQMSAFRAITAEEEASTALLLLLRERGYPDACRLSFRDHVVKHAIFPFIVEIGQFLAPISALLSPRLTVDELSDGGHQLDVIYTYGGKEFRHHPPLDLVFHPSPIDGLSPEQVLGIPARLTNAEITVSTEGAGKWILPERLSEASRNFAQMMAARLLAKSSKAGFKTFVKQVREIANQRNSLLYASSAGWPGAVKDIESVLLSRKARTLIILRIYCLLFHYKEHAFLAEQATIAFASVISEL